MFSSEISPRRSQISIDRGIECTGEYTCTKDNDKSKIQIIKEESKDLTYKISVIYHGLQNSRSKWTVHINDKVPIIDNGNLSYNGSQLFVFKPVGKETIEIQETDEQDTVSVWIDLSEEKYEAHRTLPVVSEKIQSLIEKGKVFKPAGDHEVKKIFHSKGVGVFLYARDMGWHGDIYYAKEEAEEFSKCESKKIMQCRCLAADSSWEVTLPTETVPHILEFPQGSANEGHGSSITWDQTALKSITL